MNVKDLVLNNPAMVDKLWNLTKPNLVHLCKSLYQNFKFSNFKNN